MSDCVSLKTTSSSQKPTMKFGKLTLRKIIKIVLYTVDVF